jgi:hypothetical protein
MTLPLSIHRGLSRPLSSIPSPRLRVGSSNSTSAAGIRAGAGAAIPSRALAASRLIVAWACAIRRLSWSRMVSA